MGIEFTRRPVTLPRIDLIRTPPDSYVRLLCKGNAITQVKIHCPPVPSQPCTGEGCLHHHQPYKWASYAPVETFRRVVMVNDLPTNIGSGDSGFGILEITTFLEFMLEGDLRSNLYKVGRQNGKEKGRIKATMLQRCNHPPSPAFDVRPHLYRIWKLYDLLTDYIADKKEAPAHERSCRLATTPARIPSRPRCRHDDGARPLGIPATCRCSPPWATAPMVLLRVEPHAKKCYS